ncbi:hypothetical protein GOP47_0015327 [Adiantum capillus-veneris]|uniref:ABC transporter D family member 2, chloroplastic n=1 Tax=Adiantum capillus-veneris TaxID=13818 RepID=A0A9D4ZDW7_ADICA|nr:hypothetical protein GOP47_0015327 [Adiantum capillus-veneris]
MAGTALKGAPISCYGGGLIILGSSPSFGLLRFNGPRPLLVIRCSAKDTASQASAPTSPITRHQLRDGGSTSTALHDQVSCIPDETPPSEQKRIGSGIQTILKRFWKVAAPYWSSQDKVQARLRLGGVFALTLATTGISVGFNFLGRDFYNALASKDQEQFTKQLLYYLGSFIGGIPFFVLRDYARDTLALRWRAWMTSYYLDRYFKNRTFYQIQSQSLLDNPDQRIVDDLNSFTGTALSFSLALFNATIDLISFSGILYGIYPPLFYILVVYSIGGTAISVAVGKDLVNLNFLQEKKEADFRFGLVRIRENAESIAFYGGEGNEIQLLLDRFKRSFENYSKLLVASRNLEFFQSGYRYVIQVLPAAVVAPMYFSGMIEFGVINQSYSAFNHILSDFSLIVYQFQALSAFSAVIDRLGEFNDTLERQNSAIENGNAVQNPLICLVDKVASFSLLGNAFPSDATLLRIENLSLQTPQYTMTLIEDLTLTVCEGQNLLVMGASGSGKTSLLRAIAGLWRSGKGSITRFILPPVDESNGAAFQASESGVDNNDGNTATRETAEAASGLSDGRGSILFLPQRPYMVLGTLRQQLLYPTWSDASQNDEVSAEKDLWTLSERSGKDNLVVQTTPSDDQLRNTLLKVNLGNLLERCEGLDSQVEWASVLSLGEQQRLAFARLLLARPLLALLDESTSALDEENEAALYRLVHAAGITYISVGHRSSLRKFHLLRLTIGECKQDDLGRNWNLECLDK